MPRRTRQVVLLMAAATFAAGCSPQPQASSEKPTRSTASVIAPPPSNAESPPALTDSTTKDREQLARLEREARALVKTDGCTAPNACRTAPVGWRGCGGPRTYIVYCAATTDTVTLFRKLKQLENAEKAYNAKSGMMSTCEFRMPPGTKLEGKSCREIPSAQVPGPR
jgi:hypothetical protein